jgi:type II secretory pathway component PulM
MTTMERLTTALERLAPRERRLLGVAAGVAGLVVVVHLALAVWGNLTTLQARVAARERELRAVQGLAARLRHASPPAEAAEPLLARLEQVATGTVGRDRIADMTPGTARLAAGLEEERVALRVSGASLEEVVSLLHALEAGPVPLPVTRLQLRKLPAAPAAFAATIEVARTRRVP